MADLDPNSAGNYHCVLAKNGVQQYYFGKKRIGKDKIPKQVLPSIICPQKGVALVSERVKALTSTAATLEKLEKKAEQLKKKEEKQLEKKLEKEEKKIEKKQKKAVKIGGEKPKSPEGKLAVGKGGLAKCTGKKPTDYEWLRFYWEETKQLDLVNIKQLINRYEKEYEAEYPYDDREAILILQEPRRSPRRTSSK